MAKGQNLDTIPYFDIEELPDAGIYLPAPPDTNSQLFIDDFQQWLWGKSMRHTPRGEQASWESMYSVDRMCGIYSEALGFLVSKETPRPSIASSHEASGLPPKPSVRPNGNTCASVPSLG